MVQGADSRPGGAVLLRLDRALRARGGRPELRRLRLPRHCVVGEPKLQDGVAREVRVGGACRSSTRVVGVPQGVHVYTCTGRGVLVYCFVVERRNDDVMVIWL